MKRRVEFLVRKRDGRREWLRSTKLARSVHCALTGTGAVEPWRALDVATSALEGVRQHRGAGQTITTAELAAAVERVLAATGNPHAACRYAEARAELRRRRRLWATDRSADRAASRAWAALPTRDDPCRRN